MAKVSFRVSSGLKNIIGKELITNDFIAVFELVKNSFDANATEVQIIFNDLYGDSPSIIIVDNGEGMSEKDIKEKWLFVAFSEKRDESDYRDKINVSRTYAGAKGIGRFSCDRLGANLKLVTKNKGNDKGFSVVTVDWNKFENEPKSEFQNIKADLSKTNQAPMRKFKHGTYLEITDLRDKNWNREKLLELRKSLERLINPNQGNDIDNFSIILNVPDEKINDEKIKKDEPNEPWNIINGPIINFIFETLEKKTTCIQLSFSENASELITELKDRGTLIYRLREKNPYQGTLHNIQIILFDMNHAAKINFSNLMGIPSVQYGSIFVYKNGFRIHPYGENKNDSLGLDRRKQQGYNRFLGSRELIGRIEIDGHNPEFQETTSRDGGLIRNEAYENLIELLFRYAIVRLEKYVVDLRKFGKDWEEPPEIVEPDSAELRNIAFDIIGNLTRSKEVIDIEYDSNVLDILENQSSKSVSSLLKNFKRISAEQNDTKLHKEIAKAEKQVELLKKAKEEAEAETEKERERAKEAERESKEAYEREQAAVEEARKAQEDAAKSEQKTQALITQNLFLKSSLARDYLQIIELHHSIKQDARSIDEFSGYLLGFIQDKKEINVEKFQAILERISFTARKINTISRFATQANFLIDAEEITADLIEYCREYIMNIYDGFVLDPYNKRINMAFEAGKDDNFIAKFKPINVSIVLDNLIGNSRKHKSKNINVSVVDISESTLLISVKDDGKGIQSKNIASIFELGFTTTDGSGIGLYHTRNVMSDMGGEITYNQKNKDGAEFLISFVKNI